MTPLQWAARTGESKILEKLLAGGADPNIPDKYGYSALHWAARNGNKDITKQLLANGANPNIQTHEVSKETPLHEIPTWPILWWKKGDKEGVLKELLAAGANPDIPNGFGDTLLDNTKNFSTITQLCQHLFKLEAKKFTCELSSKQDNKITCPDGTYQYGNKLYALWGSFLI